MRSPLVAVVDDDARISDLLAVELEDLGAEVLRCREGAELLAQALLDHVDLVLLDWMMPGGHPHGTETAGLLGPGGCGDSAVRSRGGADRRGSWRHRHPAENGSPEAAEGMAQPPAVNQRRRLGLRVGLASMALLSRAGRRN